MQELRAHIAKQFAEKRAEALASAKMLSLIWLGPTIEKHGHINRDLHFGALG